MKKKYEKPILLTESFQLDASIAGTCRVDAEKYGYQYIKLGYKAESCVYAGGAYFSYDNCDVDLAGELEDGNDSECYHGPLASEGILFINS